MRPYGSYETDEMAHERRISEARGDFSDTINRVAYRGERVVLTRHGRRVAAVVPVEDLELLERIEDARDLDAVREALADPENRDRVPWEDVKAELHRRSLAGIDPELVRLLPDVVQRIVDEADPVRIVLFGSHARGDATPDSDVDLLVITEGDRRDPEVVARIRRRLADLPIAKDVIVASEKQVRDYGHLVGTMLRPALSEGITLHERR